MAASCFLGALPPVDLRAVCFVRAIGASGRVWFGRCKRVALCWTGTETLDLYSSRSWLSHVTLTPPNTAKHPVTCRGRRRYIRRRADSCPGNTPHPLKTLIAQHVWPRQRWKGGSAVWTRGAVADSGSGSRKGRRQASPQDSARQHPGHHQARHPSSRASRRRQAHLWSDLRGDPWCSQDLFGKCPVSSSPSASSTRSPPPQVIRDSVTYTEHAKRKTVTALDVVYALKRSGRTLYGFGA